MSMNLNEILKLSDADLLRECETIGANIRSLMRQFAALLLEVERRQILRKNGFHSIYEFAAKVAGMNQSTVDAILNVGRKLEDKPALRALVGECGWGKLKVIAAIATPATQDFWVKQVKTMSKSTLETFVRERREVGEFTDSIGTGSSTPIAASHKSAITFRIDTETETALRIFKQQLEKHTGEVHDWNFVMKKLLRAANEHKTCDVQGRTKIAMPGLEAELQTIKTSLPKIDKRYIPARVKKYLQLKYGGKCGWPSCKWPAEIDHHVRRFALVPNHDPDFIVPLCKNHERLAHLGLIENEESSPEKWRLLDRPDQSVPKFAIDKIVAWYRGFS